MNDQRGDIPEIPTNKRGMSIALYLLGFVLAWAEAVAWYMAAVSMHDRWWMYWGVFGLGAAIALWVRAGGDSPIGWFLAAALLPVFGVLLPWMAHGPDPVDTAAGLAAGLPVAAGFAVVFSARYTLAVARKTIGGVVPPAQQAHQPDAHQID